MKGQASACLFFLGAITLPLGFACAQIPTPVVANDQTSEAADSGEILVVADNGGETRLSADSLRDAARAFNRYKPTYAPNATLYFTVLAPAPDLHLYLQRQERDSEGLRPRITLALDGEGRFVLPVATILDGSNWVLKSARASDHVRIRPIPLSPGSSVGNRRFGDLRLACRVAIAFERLALPLRGLVGMVGPCTSSRFSLYMSSPRAIASASLDGYTGPLAIRSDGMSVYAPLHDRNISNEARYHITYR